jgi:23S rRNA (uracil-5-)-methyltransferase RumA
LPAPHFEDFMNKNAARAPATGRSPAAPGQSCRAYERRECTGCTALHEPYERQLLRKEEFVRDQLGPTLAAALRQVIPSPAPMGYRTSVKLCLHEDRDGHKTVGLYRAGSRDVAPLRDCPAQAPAINRLIARLFDRRVRAPARFVTHGSRVFQKGRLKFLTIRCAPAAAGAGDGALAVIVAHTGVERAALIAWLAQAGLGGLCAYETRLTPHDGDQVTGRFVDHVSGPERFAFPLAGRTFEITPASFFQANNSLSAGLIAAATAFTAPGDLLLDLYGGFGAYSFAAAARFRGLLVVDGNAAAIAAAQRAALTDATPLRAVQAFCEDYLEKQLAPADAARVTHVIVNPPRGGLSPRVVSKLCRARLPQLRELHYVSCNPKTLARDLRMLTAQGFRLRDAEPFDMFPQTEHVEVVARLLLP